jgi:ubiquinone/menaquinone biosynthesis C-methylase UbiE
MERSWGSGAVVEGWKRAAEVRNAAMRPATELMFEEAAVVPGARVLDIGTGTGDTALLACARVGSAGSVVAIDASQSMVEAAIEATSDLGNVTVQRMDAAALEFDDDSFDAVIARQVLMFVDLPKALAGIHRVLRAGGRFATVVWGPVQDNAFHGAIIAAGRAHGGWGDAAPEVVRAFSLGDADAYLRSFSEAGFVDVAAHRVGYERRFESLAAALESVRESPLLSAPLATSSDPERAWADFESRLARFEKNGACLFPSAYLVLCGAK